jgi:hypothetical protein
VARASSKSSGSTGNRRQDTAQPDNSASPGDVVLAQGSDIAGDSAPLIPEGASDDTSPTDIGTESPASDNDRVIEAELADDATSLEAEVAPSPAAPPPAPSKAGFLPLVLGGVVAAGIGYGAAFMGWLPTAGQSNGQNPELTQVLSEQAAALAALQDQIAARATSAPQAAAPVDLTPVMDQIAALSTQIGTTTAGIEALAARVAALEDRPVVTSDMGADAAAEALAAEMEAERAAAAARAAELEAAAQAAMAEAQAAIAAAEAETASALARAEAELALGQLRTALATGAPFAEALATIAAVTTPPEALTALAPTGIATSAALQDAFPPLARAALPVALQETAGESMGERLSAFVMGQIGGRSVEPREGDGPDAVLSRVEAAVRAGDLPLALHEIAALPDGARAVLAPWVANVEARAAVEAGLAALTAALAANGN